MYIVYFRQKKWCVGWRYSSGEIHFVSAYENYDSAKAAAARMNAASFA
jgi:hypothetical protein